MTVSEAKRLKALEDEKAKLKKVLAEQIIDVPTLKEILVKKNFQGPVRCVAPWIGAGHRRDMRSGQTKAKASTEQPHK